ncbi:MAG: gliding motility-associated C-terminal domain-containing protein [Bacteroidales bacterium]|jgi:gliding motility-associated-like protein|nr:gliding motility-associated C-terminal domain-containing protein [Bacteroidales bacterium]
MKSKCCYRISPALLLAALLTGAPAGATHNRAGQIIFKHISGYTYEFTVTTFTYTLSAADRPQLDVSWGDNTVSTMERSNIEYLPDNYKKNTYVIRHTYPGSGVYTIVVEDPNRNLGVENIPNSVSVVFSVKTIFRIDANLGSNNSPELLTYPIDKAALGQVFIHNPSAFDTDGDSLSYELTPCTRDRGVEIENYSLPAASDSLVVNPVTGDLIWASPTKVGIYNVAIHINEWRQGIKIGSIARDMQIEVVDSKNRPPVIVPVDPLCVEAGTHIELDIRTTDPDGDLIQLTATGGPFGFSPAPADFSITGSGNGYTNARFSWQTDVSHVRKQPYVITLKAEDQNTEVKLVSFAGIHITVLAPKIENLTATAGKKSILLNWTPTPCPHAAGYEIYRSIGSAAVNPDSCAGGIPAESGYERLSTVEGIGNISFTDDNNGRGLSPGILYCYRVVAYFADGAKSFPSDEACTVLLSGTPPMILTSVTSIDAAGEIVVAWLRKPLDNLITGKPGPFEYRLFYTEDSASWSTVPLYTTTNLNDTVFRHSVDTKNRHSHYYQVELWDTGLNEPVDENFETSSSLYPALTPSDRSVIITFERYSPWLNTEYTIYRCTKTGDDLCLPTDSVGFTYRESYTDTGLVNGQEYCYRVRSRGYRLLENIRYNNENLSHVACTAPFDNVPPCAPDIVGTTNCSEIQNILEWTYLPDCMYDVDRYRIFHTPNRVQPYALIDSVAGSLQNTYIHRGISVGCYYVTAMDGNGNESPASNIVCMDECGAYSLPNVFSPNGDNINDLFKSFNPAGVERVDMKIYNRWGKLVFKTADADINWDGRDTDSKRFVPAGIYYYMCDVYEERLTGQQIKTITGFIHVYSGKNAQPYRPEN